MAACALPSFGVFYNSDLGKFACYKHGDIVCQQIRSRGSWEMHHVKAFAPFTEPDFTFVDVGSNVGWYTFWMARSHKVVAFEPFASNLALQNATRCAHPDLAGRITLHPFGLSNATRRCDLYQIPSVNRGDAIAACDDDARVSMERADGEKFYGRRDQRYQKLGSSVVYRLDDVADEALLNAKKVMKIDIEGHEYEMLLGARRFLTKGNPPRAIYMEVNQLGEKKKLVVSMLRRYGYDLLTLNLQADNYLFARRHRPASLRPGAAHKVRWAPEWLTKIFG